MKDQTTFSAAPGPFNLLIIGEPFSGKTVLATAFPRPGLVDCDLKATNAIAFHRAHNPNFEFKIATVDVDDAGKHVEEPQRWPRLLQQCDEMIRDPWVQTIIPDSGTKIATYLMDFLVSQPSSIKAPLVAGHNIMSQSHWYPFSVLMQRFLTKLLGCGKNVILPVHIRTDKDEVSGTLIYRPSIPGQTGETLGKLFTNFWCCKAVPTQPSPTAPRGVRYIVQSAPDTRMSLGTAVPNLPAEFEFKWESFRQYVPWLEPTTKGTT
jgi:hypothetical protein